jgi:cytochrome c peroxidase
MARKLMCGARQERLVNHLRHPSLLTAAAVIVFALAATAAIVRAGGPGLIQLQAFANSSGQIRTVTADAGDTSNPFFVSLGTNGRACVTCHDPEDAWSIAPAHLQRRFDVDGGLDPVFRPIDGANCPSADVSSEAARRSAYSLLLAKGLIRVELPVPDNAEFTVTDIDDPYECSNASRLSLYRRPLPSTNVRFLSAVMWDGRESRPGRSIEDDLIQQALDATMGHAQAGVAPTRQQLEAIVRLETGLFTAQSRDNRAGALGAAGAEGGPAAAAGLPFFIGINDPIGLNPTGAAFDPRAFTIFTPWSALTGSDDVSEARRAVARGQEIFNTRPFAVTDVPGLTDVLGPLNVTCTTCHDTPNVGNHSVAMPLDIGIGSEARRTPDMPLFTLRCADGREVRTTDPGRAMITGRCSDIGKMKGPILRGLAARPPYFHNGVAATLDEAVDFYDSRFNIGLTPQDRRDLIAFLKAL